MPSAARVRWAKFRVVVVSAAGLSILITLALLLSGGTLLEPKATIYLYIPDATGLDKDSPVRVDGIDVGKVSRVELSGQTSPNRVVRVTMVIEKELLRSITDDSYAELTNDSLIGDKFVDITSQTSPGHIMPNSEIRLKPPSDLMKTMDLQQLEEQFRQIDALLTDIETGRSQLGQFVQGTDVYTALTTGVRRIETAFHAAVSTTSQVGALLYTDAMYRQVAAPIEKIDQTLAALQSGQGPGGQLLRDTAQYDSAVKQLQDLRTSFAEVRSGVWMQSDEMYKDWNRTLVSFIQRADNLNADPMLNSNAAYENFAGMAEELRDTVKDFRQDPRKFLRLKVF